MAYLFKFVTVPEDYICSISNEIMVDPVFTADGETYEKEAINQWLSTRNTSPNTNEVLEHKTLIPNRKLKSQIAEFVEKNRKKFELELLTAVKDPSASVNDISLILNLGISVNASDENGYTALHNAIIANRKDFVELLVKKNADVTKIINYPFEQKYTLAKKDESLKEQLSQQIRLLIEGLQSENQLSELAILNQSNNFLAIITAVLFPVDNEQVFAHSILPNLDVLIEYYAKKVRDNEDCAKSKAASAKSSEDRAQSYKDSLASGAAYKHYWNVFDTMRNSDPDYRYRAEYQYVSSYEAFVSKEYNSDRCIQAANADKAEAEKHKAEAIRFRKILSCFEPRRDAIQKLLSPSVEKNNFLLTQPVHGLHLAMILGYQDIFECLIKHTKISSIQDSEGRSLLHWAVLTQNETALKYLLSFCGVEVNIQDKEGNTPLHLAAKHGVKPLIALLLEHGANHRASNLQEKMPSELGCQKFITDKVEEIKDKKIKNLDTLLCQQSQTIAALQDQMQTLMLQLQRFLPQSHATPLDQVANNPVVFFNSQEKKPVVNNSADCDLLSKQVKKK